MMVDRTEANRKKISSKILSGLESSSMSIVKSGSQKKRALEEIRVRTTRGLCTHNARLCSVDTTFPRAENVCEATVITTHIRNGYIQSFQENHSYVGEDKHTQDACCRLSELAMPGFAYQRRCMLRRSSFSKMSG